MHNLLVLGTIHALQQKTNVGNCQLRLVLFTELRLPIYYFWTQTVQPEDCEKA